MQNDHICIRSFCVDNEPSGVEYKFVLARKSVFWKDYKTKSKIYLTKCKEMHILTLTTNHANCMKKECIINRYIFRWEVSE